jgi:drug/metabolite transporter (DMT)-like permease
MQGEVAALLAAFLWAVATVLFGRIGQVLSPLVLNLVKGAMALGLVLLTLMVLQRSPLGLAPPTLLLLVASGSIGIGIGDTLYFATINRLGPRRALLMETLAPPLAALLAWMGLGEVLSLQAWAGIGLVLLGVIWVISERVPHPMGEAPPPNYRGILYGVLAALGQATGAVMSRAALVDTAIDPLWSTGLRLGGGLIILLGLVRSQGPITALIQPLRSPRLLGAVALAAFLGTYLAIYLQQTALKYAATGVAQALLSTSPLFVLPLAALLGDRVSLRAVGGVGLAIVGVGLLVNG